MPLISPWVMPRRMRLLFFFSSIILFYMLMAESYCSAVIICLFVLGHFVGLKEGVEQSDAITRRATCIVFLLL